MKLPIKSSRVFIRNVAPCTQSFSTLDRRRFCNLLPFYKNRVQKILWAVSRRGKKGGKQKCKPTEKWLRKFELWIFLTNRPTLSFCFPSRLLSTLHNYISFSVDNIVSFQSRGETFFSSDITCTTEWCTFLKVKTDTLFRFSGAFQKNKSELFRLLDKPFESTGFQT